MAAPNIVNVSSIFGKTVSATLNTTTTTDILTCPSDKVLKINTIICANIDGTNNVDVTVYFYDSSAGTRKHLADVITVPAKSTLVVISKDTSIYLEESDQIEAGASANSDCDIVISYEELDDA
tara:strand:+ start:219 stop:587 length:369 start_codon:yes stop_codon:yes gene_type:complete